MKWPPQKQGGYFYLYPSQRCIIVCFSVATFLKSAYFCHTIQNIRDKSYLRMSRFEKVLNQFKYCMFGFQEPRTRAAHIDVGDELNWIYRT